MIKKFVSVLFIIFIVITEIYGSEPALKVEIVVNQDTFADDLRNRQGAFVASTKITNQSPQEQKVQVYDCSYGLSWNTDHPEVQTGLEACLRNVPQDILLKPHEAYQRDLELAVSQKIKAGALTFKLGFTPSAENLQWRSEGTLPTDIFWSNPITVEIEPWMKDVSRYKPRQQATGGVQIIERHVSTTTFSPEVKKLLIDSGALNIPPPCPQGTVLAGDYCKKGKN